MDLMANKARPRVLGDWTLGAELGGWQRRRLQAIAADGRVGALKLLRGNQPSHERRARFRAEISFLLKRSWTVDRWRPAKHRSQPAGDASKAWYAMPMATEIRDALGADPPVEEVLRAVRQIAKTLAELATHGVSHRDLKPANLFKLDNNYVVRDFGLVTYPDKEPITRQGRRHGPIDFLAPEMRRSPDTAAGEPADVYALGKSLWCLITGVDIPLPGQHRTDNDTCALAIASPSRMCPNWITYLSSGPLAALLECPASIEIVDNRPRRRGRGFAGTREPDRSSQRRDAHARGEAVGRSPCVRREPVSWSAGTGSGTALRMQCWWGTCAGFLATGIDVSLMRRRRSGCLPVRGRPTADGWRRGGGSAAA